MAIKTKQNRRARNCANTTLSHKTETLHILYTHRDARISSQITPFIYDDGVADDVVEQLIYIQTTTHILHARHRALCNCRLNVSRLHRTYRAIYCLTKYTHMDFNWYAPQYTPWYARRSSIALRDGWWCDDVGISYMRSWSSYHMGIFFNWLRSMMMMMMRC